MTQEEKQLLLKDLCGRIYYRPKGVLLRTAFDNEEIEVIGYDGHFIDFFRKGDYDQASIDTVRLYLRPMSSMTEEEKEELSKEIHKDFLLAKDAAIENDITKSRDGFNKQDWLNAHHFDYRGLIEMGLALEAEDGMYGKL